MNQQTKSIIIGADHNGLPLKEQLVAYLQELGHAVFDMGVHTEEPVDYPDIGLVLAEAVASGEYERGILVCGTGAGMAIVANKVPGVRAVCVADPYTAERAIASNDARIITFGYLTVTPEIARRLVKIWLENEFQQGRSAPKVAKIDQVDEKYRKQGS